ncbi:MAG TPA: sensor histidine kinase, partial [Clostridiales bacterium]|nr:sensor histidine kinase [Clostridiales bacterium]
MLKLCAALLGILAGAMLLFWAISRKLSAIAARPMEEAIQREKQFVADASHDLKTPLSVILANNSILMENPDTPVGELNRWLDSTQLAASRMRQLIGEMLTLAEAERQDAPLTLERVDLADIAMKAELELESVAFEKQVTLDTNLPDRCILRGNADYLLRIVTSL